MSQEPLHHTLIKHFESCKLKPYLCSAGVPTIGWGSTYYPDGRKVTMKDPGITQEAADALFLATLAPFQKAVAEQLPRGYPWQLEGALVSFAFNVGITAFKTSTLLKLLRVQAPGATDQLLRWNKVNGAPTWGLHRRRLAERHFALTGTLKLDWDRKEHGF